MVGDTVRVLVDGWQEAKIIQVQAVLMWSIYPMELRCQKPGRSKYTGWENSRPRITRPGNTISMIGCKRWSTASGWRVRFGAE